MTLNPIIYASFAVQLHVIAAVLSILLGPVVLWRRSRDRWHKWLGYAWVIAMATTALSSFGISITPVVGPFGPIHALSVFTLWSLWQGINAARRHDIKSHQQNMRSLYFWAIGVAGMFTFLPGRRMNEVFFADAPMAGFALVAALVGSGLVFYHFSSRKTAQA